MISQWWLGNEQPLGVSESRFEPSAQSRKGLHTGSGALIRRSTKGAVGAKEMTYGHPGRRTHAVHAGGVGLFSESLGTIFYFCSPLTNDPVFRFSERFSHLNQAKSRACHSSAGRACTIPARQIG